MSSTIEKCKVFFKYCHSLSKCFAFLFLVFTGDNYMYHAMVLEASVSERQMRPSAPGKDTLQDAKDFYAWKQSPYYSLKTIKFIFLPTEDYHKKLDNVSSQN